MVASMLGVCSLWPLLGSFVLLGVLVGTKGGKSSCLGTLDRYTWHVEFEESLGERVTESSPCRGYVGTLQLHMTYRWHYVSFGWISQKGRGS